MSDITMIPFDYIVKHTKTENIVSIDEHGDYVCDIETEYIPLAKGEWIDKGADLDGTWYYQCSECSAEVENVKYPHCPYCLARMKGETEQ